MLSLHDQIYMHVHDDFSTHPYTILYIVTNLFISYGENRVYHERLVHAIEMG